MLFSKPKYDYLIVGLGNPGDKYEQTRHNVGFRCIDTLCQSLSPTPEKQKFHAAICETQIKDKRVLLCKPLTFMNGSGTAVSEIVRFYKIPIDRVLVISDDCSLDAGRLRLRESGSHGGHNGLRDIIDLLGSDAFPRVKIGVGQKPHPEYDLADWVLGKPSKEDAEKIDKTVKDAAEAVKFTVTSSVRDAMNKFNR